MQLNGFVRFEMKIIKIVYTRKIAIKITIKEH